MVFEESGILYQVVVRNTSDKLHCLELAFDVPGRIKHTAALEVAVYQSSDHQETMVHAPVNGRINQTNRQRIELSWNGVQSSNRASR